MSVTFKYSYLVIGFLKGKALIANNPLQLIDKCQYELDDLMKELS